MLALAAGAALLAFLLLRPGGLPPAQPAPPQGELARFLPLSAAATVDFDWFDGVDSSMLVRRAVGWVRLDGRPHVQLEYARAYGRRELYLTEWLCFTETQALCSRRQVGNEGPLDLDPPQPVLQLPLTQGARWSWSGQVGGVPAQAEFEVLSHGPHDPYDEALEVQARTTIGGETGTSVLVYAAGQGPVAGHGRLPRGDLTRSLVQFELSPPQAR